MRYSKKLRSILIVIFVFFKIDKAISYIKIFFTEVDLYRVGITAGIKINYACQGFNGVKIMSSDNDFSKFYIHETSHLKSDTVIECTGGVQIGRYFHPGRGLTIFSTNHNYRSSTSIPYDEIDLIQPVIIKDFVWAGANVTIVPGVTIGEGVVIGAGAVVTKNIPDYAIVAGNPATIISYRDTAKFNELKSLEKFL